MSKKESVGEAALKALSRPTVKSAKKKTKAAKAKTEPEVKAKHPLPQKGSAEAESHKQAAKANAEPVVKVKQPLPQKGSAEAIAHNLASIEAAGKKSRPPAKSGSAIEQGSGIGFLSLALLLPLVVVGGLYIYASSTQNQPNPSKSSKTLQPDVSQPSTPASASPSATKKVAAATSSPVVPKKVGVAKSVAKKPASSTNTPPWDYHNTDWASIDPSFKTCGEGRAQSPIDIVATQGQTGPRFEYNYRPSNGKVQNNGHSVQVDLAKGNQLLVNNKAYDLIQFHFHTPSENRLNGRSYPMEVHLVHKDAQGQLAVVAAMITTGSGNRLLDQMPVPENKGDVISSGGAHINPLALLPQNRSALTFSGSLTTPPCTENVGWIVMKTPLQVSSATLARFQKVMGQNNRPLQPANGRTIYPSN